MPKQYDVMAVFLAPVYGADFKWYQYGGKLNQAQYDTYVEQVKEMALYDTGVTAEYGQRLITLETCASSEDSTRFVVVARERMEDK